MMWGLKKKKQNQRKKTIRVDEKINKSLKKTLFYLLKFGKSLHSEGI
jgi:hypothetical protein